MKTTRIVLFLMVLSILWCADVFAHWFDDQMECRILDNGEPAAHFCPGTRNDPCGGENVE